MPSPEELLKRIEAVPEGLSITDILARHPALARRTAQRWLNEWVAQDRIQALGAGRARRYAPLASAATLPAAEQDAFPQHIPLSADSRDILIYIDQPTAARRPVGYQRDFLDT